MNNNFYYKNERCKFKIDDLNKMGILCNEENLNNQINYLYDEFIKIKNMNYILGKHKGCANAGLTLENLLGLNNHSLEIPDFNGIEIKTKKIFSNRCIKLFTSVPDGEELFEIKRLVNRFGYPDKIDRHFNVMCGEIFCNKLNRIGAKYLYKLDIDYKNEKIFLEIYNKKSKLIDKNISWSFYLIKKKLERKLKVMAVIDVDKRIRNNLEYFKYINIDFFILKDFDTFIKLIENGIISISINIGIYRDQKRYGHIFDHGTAFGIRLTDIEKLYTKYKLSR